MGASMTIAIGAVDGASRVIIALSDSMEAFGKKVSSIYETISTRYMHLRMAVTDVVGAITGMARKVGDVFGSILGAGADWEMMTVRMTALEGSTQKAAETMDFLRERAKTLPGTLNDLVGASASLKAFGMDIRTWVDPLADVAAFMQITLPEAASAMGRAFAGGAGAADIFREKGVLGIIAKQAGITYDALLKLDKAEFQKKMYEAFTAAGTGIAGMSDKLGKTLGGLMSNVTDSFDEFKRQVADAIFPAAKRAVESFLVVIAKLSADGTLRRWALQAGIAMAEMWNAGLDFIPTFISGLGKVGDTFYALRKIVLALAINYQALSVASSGFSAFVTQDQGAKNWYAAQKVELGKMSAQMVELTENQAKMKQSFASARESVAGITAPLKVNTDELRKQLETLDKMPSAAARAMSGASGSPKITGDGPTDASKGDKNAFKSMLDGVKDAVSEAESQYKKLIKGVTDARKDLADVTKDALADEKLFAESLADIGGVGAEKGANAARELAEAIAEIGASMAGSSLNEQASALRRLIAALPQLAERAAADGTATIAAMRELASNWKQILSGMEKYHADYVKSISDKEKDLADLRKDAAQSMRDFADFEKELAETLGTTKNVSTKSRKSAFEDEMEAIEALTGQDKLDAIKRLKDELAGIAKQDVGEGWITQRDKNWYDTQSTNLKAMLVETNNASDQMREKEIANMNLVSAAQEAAIQKANAMASTADTLAASLAKVYSQDVVSKAIEAIGAAMDRLKGVTDAIATAAQAEIELGTEKAKTVIEEVRTLVETKLKGPFKIDADEGPAIKAIQRIRDALKKMIDDFADAGVTITNFDISDAAGGGTGRDNTPGAQFGGPTGRGGGPSIAGIASAGARPGGGGGGDIYVDGSINIDTISVTAGMGTDGKKVAGEIVRVLEVEFARRWKANISALRRMHDGGTRKGSQGLGQIEAYG